MKLKVLISEGEDGWFVVECPSIPGLHLSGEDRREGSAIIKEAIEGCMEVMGEQILVGNGSLGDGSSCLVMTKKNPSSFYPSCFMMSWLEEL